MKTLASALAAMQRSHADKIVMVAEKPTLVAVQGQTLSGPVVTAEELHAMVMDSAPEHLLENFKNGWPVQFDVIEGTQPISVSVVSHAGVLQVECTTKEQTTALQPLPATATLATPVANPHSLQQAIAPPQVANVANVLTPTIMCSIHAERPAAGVCAYSGKFYCQEDLVLVDGKQYGQENLSRVMAEIKETAGKGNTPQVFMNAGGGSSSSSSAAAAAVSAPVVPLSEEVSPYKRETALLLCAIGVFGIAGIHRFYTGHFGTGAAQFVTIGGCWLWTLADLLALVTRTFRDEQGRLVQ
jgi:hypothetical protein